MGVWTSCPPPPRGGGWTSLIKEINKERNKTPGSNFHDPQYKNIAYVRYAGDFIIGVKGSYADAKAIKGKISKFLKNIGLDLNDEKTKITNINKDRVMFLGTYLFRTSCLAPLTKKIAKQGGARQGGARHLDQPPLQSKGGWTRHRKYRDIEGVGKRKFRRRDALKIRLEAPLVRILKNLTESQFMKKGKSSPKYS